MVKVYKLDLSARDALLIEEALKNQIDVIKQRNHDNYQDYERDADYIRAYNFLDRLEKEIL